MTKCCSSGNGGGIYLKIVEEFGSVRLLFSHLILLSNKADFGAGMGMFLGRNNGPISVHIKECVLSQGHETYGGAIHLMSLTNANLIIQNSEFIENSGYQVSEIHLK